MNFNTQDILTKLDTANEGGNFPPVQMEDYYNAGIKLKVFVNDSEWIIMFESLDYTETDYTFVKHIKAYGNHIEGIGYYDMFEIITEVEELPFFDEEDFDKFLLDPFHFEVNIFDQSRAFSFTEKDYQAAGIDLHESVVPTPAKILRMLSHTIPHTLFSSNEALLQHLDKDLNSFQVFIELDSWHHPDIVEMEVPSENSCFQSLAEAIAHQDASIYNCPKVNHNTHWSNWAWYEEDEY